MSSSRAALCVGFATAAAIGQPTFLVDANGRPAVVAERWDVRDDNQPIGIIGSIARCADRIFLADAQGKIRQLDAASGKLIGMIGCPPGGDAGL